MSIEPTCQFCGASDKFRCKNLEEATSCTSYEKHKPKPKIDFSFDFGFSDEPEITQEQYDQSKELHNELQSKVLELNSRLEALHAAVIPLLDKLCQGGEKDIHWPNRAKQIKTFKKKLTEIVEGKI